METLFDVRALYEAYQEGRPAADQGVRIERVALTSAHDDMLVEEDRGVAANGSFDAPLLTPDRDGPFDEVVVLFHGLNEGTDAKLLPWAANLARRGMPALVFPSSFHLARRPASFLEARGEAFAARRAVAGNARSSPYNALLSRRMAERPDRFVRGTMQTYRDVVDLARGLRDGAHPTLSGRFRPGARVSFLAYSIGGYLAKLALIVDPEGLFTESRCVLFSTGAALYDVRPQTILILDVDAQQRLYAYYDTEEGRTGRHPSFDAVRADARERAALSSMLYAGPPLVDALRGLGGRVAGVANVADTVFPYEAVKKTFDAVSSESLELGLHELPFNQRGPLGDAYSDKEGRRLLLAVVKAYAVAEDLRPGFAKFVELCAQQLVR
jgi:hypothetical protein